MWNWVRYIPVPGYKKCGGRTRDCSTSPVQDWMDLAFEKHDQDLNLASKESKKGLRKLAKRGADKRLGKALRRGDKKKLGLWGRIYLFGAKIVFRV